LVSDVRLQFKLVKVTRTKTTKSGFGVDECGEESFHGGIAPFSPKTHLNLWVCALTGGLLVMRQFPGGPTVTDGVVINYRAFGTIGAAEAPF